MKILAVETATRCQSVAIIDDQALLGQEIHEDCESHTSVLIPTIETLLSSVDLDLTDLDGLAVSIGPGSFTGLRVGLSATMAFRLVTNLPIVTVPTLEAMAWNAFGRTTGILCPLLKSRVGEVYWAQFQWKGDSLVRLSEDTVQSVEQIAQSIEAPSLMFGEGWLANRDVFRDLLGDRCLEGSPEIMQASARSVGLASLSSFKAKRYATRRLSPRYIQRAKAEVAWETKAPQASS